ncbi:MAG TPA: YdeI/OmpD-associated family protein [Rhodothermia bacterium]
MPKQRFKAVIEAHPSGGAYVNVPFEVEKVFGRKRVKILATFDGEPYRGLLTPMGTPHHILIVRKDIREKIGKAPGDEVTVTVEEDLEPRVVNVPPDVRRILDDNHGAADFFLTLSFTHQREYVEWIEEAKKPETRARRIARMIELLNQEQRAR